MDNPSSEPELVLKYGPDGRAQYDFAIGTTKHQKEMWKFGVFNNPEKYNRSEVELALSMIETRQVRPDLSREEKKALKKKRKKQRKDKKEQRCRG